MTPGISIVEEGGPAAGTSTPRGLGARGAAAGAVLLAVPSLMVVRAMASGHVDRFLLLFFATYLVGAAALTRRSPLAQVVGRGIACKVLVVQAGVLAARAALGDVRLLGVLLVVAPALALALARPLLHTPVARAAFAPRASRALFLAASTASIAAAAYAAPLALRAWTYGSPVIAAALSLLLGALVAQAAAVLRMRAWGVVLGVATAVGMVCARVVGVADPTFAAITAIPGLALAGAVIAAWLRPPTSTEAPLVRVAATSGKEERARIAAEVEELTAPVPHHDSRLRATS